MMYLDGLTDDMIKNMPLPLNEILNNACYYPACKYDGRPIRFSNMGLGRKLNIVNFVYCDFAVHLEELQKQEDTFKGYSIIGTRDVFEHELVPNGWTMRMPPNFNWALYREIVINRAHSFCRWIVYERNDGFDEQHGPLRFSLLYISGEGMATYQALFHQNNVALKLLVITDHGFGNNITEFRDMDGPFYWVVNNQNDMMPQCILYNGDHLNWPDYLQRNSWKEFTIWWRQNV